MSSKLQSNAPIVGANVYYTASFVNNSPQPALAQIYETRTQALLSNPEEWQMSVIRFDVSTSILPINIPVMQDVVNRITSSIITFTYQGSDYGANIVITPSGNTTGLNPNLIYPAIFSIQKWLDDINLTIEGIWAPPSGPAPPFAATSTPPKFIYDPDSKLIKLYIDQHFVPSISGANTIAISFNFYLWQYFANFIYFFQGYNPSNNKAFNLLVPDEAILTAPAVGARIGYPLAVQAAPATLYVYSQSNNSIQRWNSLRSLIIVSNLVPIRLDNLPQNVQNSNNFNSASTLPILTDFLLPRDQDPTLDRDIVEYLPTAEYRWVDLISNNPLTSLDFQFFYTDFLGNIYPLFLDPYASMNLKVVFRKKYPGNET